VNGTGPPAPEAEYSVVIPAYDEEAFLPNTLAVLGRAMAAVKRRGEVVVCDNNSKDRTAELARAAGARVVFEPVNQIARARNTGARAARAPWLVFLDADTRLPARLLERALEALASGTVAGGGATVTADIAPGSLMARTLRVWNRLSRWQKLAAGSFVFARADAFAAVGGFSEKVYASEEIWLSRAIRRWGRRRGLDFVILDGDPVETSSRKAEWFSQPLMAAVMLSFMLFPFLVRSRAFCFLWYRRPAR
jgi:glycosyltransferase involved in cell wall biosynthesis